MSRRTKAFIRNDKTSLCVSVCVRTPVEAAKNIKTSVFSSVEIHAEDGREDEQHHGKVKHHHHCSLQQQNTENLMLFYGKSCGLGCRAK